jgi:hypothetical protein
VSIRGFVSCGSLHQFLDFCSLPAWYFCTPSISLVYWGLTFFLIKVYYLSKKKKKFINGYAEEKMPSHTNNSRISTLLKKILKAKNKAQ